jgi:hypothetical protein
MKFLRKLFGKDPAEQFGQEQLILRSSDLITELASGANLVDGSPTWQHAESGKNDLQTMLRCCDAELETMERTGFVAAPFYFERAAILLRKSKDIDREVLICEQYISAVEQHYNKKTDSDFADVRKGPRYQAIQSRLVKARLLRDKHRR